MKIYFGIIDIGFDKSITGKRTRNLVAITIIHWWCYWWIAGHMYKKEVWWSTNGENKFSMVKQFIRGYIVSNQGYIVDQFEVLNSTFPRAKYFILQDVFRNLMENQNLRGQAWALYWSGQATSWKQISTITYTSHFEVICYPQISGA